MKMPNLLDRKRLKDRIVESISRAVKQIQKYHLCEDQPDIVLSNDDWQFQKLVEHMDHALLHGLKHITNGYWVVVQEFTHKDVIKEIKQYQKVTTNLGRGRAWLYMALSDHLLESYLRCFADHTRLVRQFYAKEALVLDQQRMELLLMLSSGLEHICFQLDLDVPYLDLASHIRLRFPRTDEDDDDRISLCSIGSTASQSSINAIDSDSSYHGNCRQSLPSINTQSFSKVGGEARRMRNSASLPIMEDSDTERSGKADRLSNIDVRIDSDNDIEVIHVKAKGQKSKRKKVQKVKENINSVVASTYSLSPQTPESGYKSVMDRSSVRDFEVEDLEASRISEDFDGNQSDSEKLISELDQRKGDVLLIINPDTSHDLTQLDACSSSENTCESTSMPSEDGGETHFFDPRICSKSGIQISQTGMNYVESFHVQLGKPLKWTQKPVPMTSPGQNMDGDFKSCDAKSPTVVQTSLDVQTKIVPKTENEIKSLDKSLQGDESSALSPAQNDDTSNLSIYDVNSSQQKPVKSTLKRPVTCRDVEGTESGEVERQNSCDKIHLESENSQATVCDSSISVKNDWKQNILPSTLNTSLTAYCKNSQQDVKVTSCKQSQQDTESNVMVTSCKQNQQDTEFNVNVTSCEKCHKLQDGESHNFQDTVSSLQSGSSEESYLLLESESSMESNNSSVRSTGSKESHQLDDITEPRIDSTNCDDVKHSEPMNSTAEASPRCHSNQSGVMGNDVTSASSRDTQTACDLESRHECEILVDNNMKLYLMLEVFQDEEEQLVKMFQTCLGHTEGDVRFVYVLITDRTLYIITSGSRESRFAKEAIVQYRELDYISLSINYQVINVVCTNRRKQYWITTGDEALTKCIVGSLHNVIRHSELDFPRLSVLTDATTQKIAMKKWVSSEPGMEFGEIQILCYCLVHWEDHLPTTASNIKVGNCIEGVLHCKTNDYYLFGGSVWKPNYFVLKNGILYQYSDRHDNSPPKMCIQLNCEDCGGCRRSLNSDRQHSFEVILSDGSVLQLSANSSLECQQWLQSLCQAVSEGMGVHLPGSGCLACCAVVTSSNVIMCHEDVQTNFFRTLSSRNITDIATVHVDEAVPNSCVLVFKPHDSSTVEIQWIIFFNALYERTRFLTALETAWLHHLQERFPVQAISDPALKTRCADGVSILKKMRKV